MWIKFLWMHQNHEIHKILVLKNLKLYGIHGTKGVKAKIDPLFVTVNINGKQASMELNTRSAVTIMAERDLIRFLAGVNSKFVYILW